MSRHIEPHHRPGPPAPGARRREALSPQLAAQHRAIRRWGGEFNGESWVLAAMLARPLAETVLVLASDPDEYRRSGAPGVPTGFGLEAVLTEDGPVAVVDVKLFLPPDEETWVYTMLNPANKDGRALLARLAEQETLQILFYDRHDGYPFGRRLLVPTADFRASAAETLRVTEGMTTTAGRFRRAIAEVGAQIDAGRLPAPY